MKDYFVVVLNDGRELDFEKKCDSINYSNDKYTVFKQSLDDNEALVLAVIPHTSIYTIEKHSGV